jgi:hypothetical protein
MDRDTQATLAKAADIAATTDGPDHLAQALWTAVTGRAITEAPHSLTREQFAAHTAAEAHLRDYLTSQQYDGGPVATIAIDEWADDHDTATETAEALSAAAAWDRYQLLDATFH